MLHSSGPGNTPMYEISRQFRDRIKRRLEAGEIPVTRAALYIPM